MLPTDPEVEIVKGVEGARKKTVTYSLNKETGAKTPNQPTYETIKNKVDRVVEYGAGKTKEGSIPIIYTNGPDEPGTCLLYTSPSPRDQRGSRMPSSA